MDAEQLEIRPLKAPFLGGSSVSYVDREIDFVPARKRFNGLAYSNGDFKIETLNASCPPEPSGKVGSTNLSLVSGPAKKADALDALESWMDQELSLRVSFQRIGAGLENLGNTCFLNSVLQCLTYTEPLAAYLQTGKHQSSCRINGFCALCAIQKHVSRALQATGRSLAPKDLVSNLRSISRSFRNARQEDAHEYMVNLLESMHKCCLPSGVPSESPSAYEKSLVHQIFGGRLRSQVKCLQCNYCSNKFDPFIDLSLEIARADSVLKALGHFTAAEHLDGGAKHYQCQKCKEKVRALKQLTVHKAPYVLTIHLKRFHSFNTGEKINKNVRFDTKLDLKPFVSDPHEGDLKYSLYGVLVHHGGSTRSGHYLCYVRTSTNMWYLLNDNTVLQVSESTVLQQKAYMLFYIRNRDTTPRRRAEMAQKEILKEKHTLNRGSFSFSQSSSCAVQFSQTTDKSGSAVSSCSVITKDMVSIHKADRIMNGASDSGSTVSGSVKETNKPAMPTLVNNDGDIGKSAIPIAADIKVNEHCLIVKDSTASVAQSPISNDIKDGNDKMMVEHRITHENTGDKINTDSMVSGKQSSRKINKVDPLKERQKAADDNEKSTCEKSVVLTATTVAHCESSEVEKIDCKGQSKIKKKHSKHRLTIVHFGTNVFLRASLGSRKKHMKKKQPRSSKIKKDCANSDLGPSTSESRNLDKVKSHKKRKGDHKGQKDGNRSSDEVGRTSENGAVLASEFQAPKNTSLTTESSQTEAKAVGTAIDGKGDSMQNCFMSMLTRGIEGTIIAHWDDVNTTPSPTMESNATITSIGHVLDEWEEEYDRGKRKKIRISQHEYDGPNLFQQVASNKFKSKKAKLDRARSGNKPFRI